MKSDSFAFFGYFTTGLYIAGSVPTVLAIGGHDVDFFEMWDLNSLHVDCALFCAGGTAVMESIDYAVHDVAVRVLWFFTGGFNFFIPSNSKLFVLFRCSYVVYSIVFGFLVDC